MTGSVVRGLKKIFLSMVAMVYLMTWLLAMFSFLLCYRKSELLRSFKKTSPTVAYNFFACLL